MSSQIQTPQLGELVEPEERKRFEELPLKLNTIDPDLPMGFKQ
jgi:hypothetical protein